MKSKHKASVCLVCCLKCNHLFVAWTNDRIIIIFHLHSSEWNFILILRPHIVLILNLAADNERIIKIIQHVIKCLFRTLDITMCIYILSFPWCLWAEGNKMHHRMFIDGCLISSIKHKITNELKLYNLQSKKNNFYYFGTLQNRFWQGCKIVWTVGLYYYTCLKIVQIKDVGVFFKEIYIIGS